MFATFRESSYKRAKGTRKSIKMEAVADLTNVTDIDSIALDVLNNSFNEIDISEFDKLLDAPVRSKKDMELLRRQCKQEAAISNSNNEEKVPTDSNQRNCTTNNGNESSCSGKDLREHIADEKLYCICHSKYNKVEPMVACDGVGCNEWFHLSCVGLPYNWSSSENWYCSVCIQNVSKIKIKILSFVVLLRKGMKSFSTSNINNATKLTIFIC